MLEDVEGCCVVVGVGGWVYVGKKKVVAAEGS